MAASAGSSDSDITTSRKNSKKTRRTMVTSFHRVGMILIFLTCYLPVVSCWTTWEGETEIHRTLTKRELESLLGPRNPGEALPEYNLASVELRYATRERRFKNDEDETENVPHLTASINVRSEVLTFHLYEQTHLISPAFEMQVVHDDETEIISSETTTTECLYQGHVTSHPEGQAALSTCGQSHKLSGIIVTGGRHYVIKPIPACLCNRTFGGGNEGSDHVIYTNADPGWHGINSGTHDSMVPPDLQPDEGTTEVTIEDDDDSYDAEKTTTTTANQVIDVENEIPTDDPRDNDVDSNYDVTVIRRKRAAKATKVVEVAVFTDNVMYDQVKKEVGSTKVNDEIRDIVFAMINAVQLHYNQKSLDQPFKLNLVKLQIISSASKGPDQAGGEIKQYLTNFCEYQMDLNPGTDSDTKHWDHAVLLSGKDLFQTTKNQSKVIGLAWVEGMCRPKYSCSINEGNNFESVFVISHEMGHNLGMHHDGNKGTKKNDNTCDATKYIMSPTLGPGKITWSTCSRDYLKNFAAKPICKCMNDAGSTSKDLDHEKDGRLPGQRYTVDTQCKKAFGSSYRPYTSSSSPFDNICRELWCRLKTQARRAHPALEGTKCATGKVCSGGKCVSETASAKG